MSVLPMVEGGKALHEMRVYDEGLLQFPISIVSCEGWALTCDVCRKGESQTDKIGREEEEAQGGQSIMLCNSCYLSLSVSGVAV